MGNWVIVTPDDTRQPLLWDLGWVCRSQPWKLMGNILFRCVVQHKKDNYSIVEDRQKKLKA